MKNDFVDYENILKIVTIREMIFDKIEEASRNDGFGGSHQQSLQSDGYRGKVIRALGTVVMITLWSV